MDIFGIGQASIAAVKSYRRMMRGTGRTTQLCHMVREGDTVVFINSEDRRAFTDTMKSLGYSTEGLQLVFCCPSNPAVINDKTLRGNATGNLYFDHSWLEQFYEFNAISGRNYLDRLSTHMCPKQRTHREKAEDPARRWHADYRI